MTVTMQSGVGPPGKVVQRLLARSAVADLPDETCTVLIVDHVDTDVLDGLRVRCNDNARVVIVLPAETDLSPEACWQVLRGGAADVIHWHGADTLDELLSRASRWQDVDRLVSSRPVREAVIGRSPALKRVLAELVELAVFSRADVLITGDTGTGKELAATIVHELDPLSRGRLVVTDCTTIVPTLSGSELFGHERGAFTGAVSTRPGAFAAANGGTLFLDEVGELPAQLQAELLRVLQEHVYKRVGSDVWQRTTFRLVAATNRDLVAEQARGGFRRDLFYRLASGVVRLPTLAERTEDIEPLFRHFLRPSRMAARAGPRRSSAAAPSALSGQYSRVEATCGASGGPACRPRSDHRRRHPAW